MARLLMDATWCDPGYGKRYLASNNLPRMET